jgi:hypothetical protein
MANHHGNFLVVAMANRRLIATMRSNSRSEPASRVLFLPAKAFLKFC